MHQYLLHCKIKFKKKRSFEKGGKVELIEYKESIDKETFYSKASNKKKEYTNIFILRKTSQIP